MSFDIDWEKIRGNGETSRFIKEFINDHLSDIELPKYVKNLKVIHFELGDIPPEIEIKQISDPLPDFYEGEGEGDEANEETEVHTNNEEEESSDNKESTPYSNRSEMDIQMLLDIAYKGNMAIEVSADLAINYPTESFVSLPIKLSISNIGFHSLCLIAYLKSTDQCKESVSSAEQVDIEATTESDNKAFFSLLCDVADPELDTLKSLHTQDLGKNKSSSSETRQESGASNSTSRHQHYHYPTSMERMQFIRTMSVKTEIGGDSTSFAAAAAVSSSIDTASTTTESSNTALKNIGELETFLLEILRNIIRKEVCWPGWIELEL